MTKLRKFFASSVMVMTVVVMSGLTAPMATKAAASAGDLIKKDGLSAVYYLGEDGKRYVFPNEATYKSWYSDFSGVVTISSDELASYPLGGNVVIRPGTKLVKITTDPKVYAVEANGTLRWVQTEADAIALYGANWAQRVVDVADSFFTNYTIGTPLASGEVPMGVLVQKSGEGNIYYYDGTNYRLVEDEVAFLANKFQFGNVLTFNSFTAGGSTITGAEAAIIKTSQAGGGSGWQPGQGTGVTVSLNSMTPASNSVPTTVGRIPFTKVNLTASADGAAYIDAITITRSGLTTIGTSFKVWAEKDGAVVASKKTLTSNDDAILNFSPVLTIPAGQTITLDILAEVSVVTGNGALGIASASDISAGGSTVSGSFPITGNTMSFTSYSVTTLTFDASTTTASVKVGDEDVELGRFALNFASNLRDVVFGSITLRNYGLEDLAKTLMNVRLEQNNEVISNNATFNGRYVTFTMKNGGYDMLKDDGDKTFVIKGDVIGKDVTGTPSLNLKLNKTEDIYAYEKATGFGASITSPVTNSVVSSQTITAGSVSVSKKSTSPSATSIIKGTNGVVALIANIKVDEAIKADGLKIYYLNNSAGDADSTFQNIKVYLNNVLLESFNATATSASAYTGYMVDSALNLNKGDNEVKITFDVKSNGVASDKIRFQLQSGSNLLDLPEYVSNGISVSDISGSATGEYMTVEGGAFTVVRNDGYANDKPYIKGSTDVSLGKFAIKASNDSIKLTSVVLGSNGATGTQISDTHVSDMKLFVDGVQIGTTKNFSSGATFSSLNYTIAKNDTKVIELKGSFDSTGTGTLETLLSFSAQDSLAKEITGSHTASTTRILVEDSGTLTIAADANTPYADVLIANSALEQEISRLKLTATKDSANVTEITIANVGTTTPTTTTVTDPRINSYKLYLGSTLIDTAIPVSGAATFYITGNKLVVPADGSQTISVKAVFNSISVSTETNMPLKLRVTAVTAKSSNGAEISSPTITSGAESNLMYIRKTKPTFAKVNGITGSQGALQEVARFTVGADAIEDLQLTAIAFTQGGTGAASTTDFVLYEVGNPTALATSTTADFSGFATVVSKGTSKTFVVKGNTNGVASDATFGLSLSDVAGTNNILWNEYFVANGFQGSYDSSYVDELPLDFGSMKY
ncbi:MAG: hypothetical protein PHP37_03515 [Patescibacteria group bacterium]|nr:hypothetical protein [Patescibacteria group bacterium]